MAVNAPSREASAVYHAGPRCSMRSSLVDKTRRLCEKADLSSVLREGDLVAVKVHWGEPGNTTFLPPPFVATVCEQIKEAGAHPFLTDTSTLYRGQRRNAVTSILAATRHGYAPYGTGAPVIVADGLRGRDARSVAVPGGKHVKEARIAAAVHEADAMIVLSHFKGHELFGFGGALKNLGMGCSTPAGKQVMHSDLKPQVKRDACIACGRCISVCPADAISMKKEKAAISHKACLGCGDCTTVCPVSAIPVRWKTDERPILEKTAEYAWASLDGKRDRCLFFNFMLAITPLCDCYGHSDLAVVPDLGIAASADPVALDQACADLFNRSPVVPGSALAEAQRDGDLLQKLHGIDWRIMLAHAEGLGMGSRAYELIRLEEEDRG